MTRRLYPTDLTDAQWEIVRAAMPPARGGRTGAPRAYALCEIWNAIFYQAKNGCTWRVLPHDLPPWPAVWQQYRRWRGDGTLEAVHATLREQVRRKAGRASTPSDLASTPPHHPKGVPAARSTPVPHALVLADGERSPVASWPTCSVVAGHLYRSAGGGTRHERRSDPRRRYNCPR